MICSVSGVIQLKVQHSVLTEQILSSQQAPLSTDVVDFVLVLGETVSTGTPSDGTVTDAQLNSTLDLSSKTVTLPNTSVTNAQLQIQVLQLMVQVLH